MKNKKYLILIILTSLLFSFVISNNNNNNPSYPSYVYFGERIEEKETLFYYYDINFKFIDEKLNNLLNTFPENKEIIMNIQDNFKDIFNEESKKPLSISRPTPSFYTKYYVSCRELPDLYEKFENNNNNTDMMINEINETITTLKMQIETFINSIPQSHLLELPNYYRVNKMGMPWPLWINDIQIYTDYWIQFQLIRHIPSLLDLLPLPLSHPPPLNSMFTLSKWENSSSHLLGFIKRYKKNISLSTIIPIEYIQQNCNDAESFLCFLPPPQDTVIVKITETGEVKGARKNLHSDLLSSLLKETGEENEKGVNCSSFSKGNIWEECVFFTNKSIKVSFYNVTKQNHHIPPFFPSPPYHHHHPTATNNIACPQLIIPTNAVIIILIIVFITTIIISICGIFIYTKKENEKNFSYFKTEVCDDINNKVNNDDDKIEMYDNNNN